MKSRAKPKRKPATTKAAKKPSPKSKTVKPKRKSAMTTEKAPEKPAAAPAPKAAPPKDGAGKAGDQFKTEQEKGGKDPISPAEPSPGPVETTEEQGIGPRDPYPSKE